MKSPRRRTLALTPVCLLTLLAIGPSGACRRDREVTVVNDVATLLDRADGKGTPLALQPLGSHLTVSMPLFGGADFYPVVDSRGFVAARDVASFPITGREAFVTAQRLPVRTLARAAVKELSMGMLVTTLALPTLTDAKLLAIVEGGNVVGFVEESGIGTSMPAAAQFASFARAMVREADYAAAIRLLGAGLRAYPDDPSLAPWLDLAKRAYGDPLGFTPPPRLAAVAPVPAVKKPGPAYVAPLSTPVLAEPSATAKTTTVLRQNTLVRVTAIRGDFAEVTLAAVQQATWAPYAATLDSLPQKLPAALRAAVTGASAVAPNAEGPEEAAAATYGGSDRPRPGVAATGFVALAALQGAPNTTTALLERAKKAQADHKADEALELLTRAVGLGNFAPDASQALFDASVAANDLERAVWGTLFSRQEAGPLFALREATGWSTPTVLEVALLQGCKPPLSPGSPTEVVAMFARLARPSPGQCLLVTHAAETCLDCGLPEAQAQRKFEREQRAGETFFATADELYPQGPFLRLTLANTTAEAGPPRLPVFITYDDKTYWLPILALGAFEHVSLYVQIDTYRDLYAVSLGDEHAAARAESAPEFVVTNPSTATVWIGVAPSDCQECLREGDGEHFGREGPYGD